MFTPTIVAHKIFQPLKYQIIKIICSEICMEMLTHEIAAIVVLEVMLDLI